MSFLTVRAIVFSILVHILLLGLMFFSLDIIPSPVTPSMPDIPVMDAVTIDNDAIEQEISRLREIEQQRENEQLQKQQALENRLRQLEQEANRAEQQRRAEEKRLADLKLRQQEEEKKRQTEEARLAAAKKQQQELEQKRRREEEQRKQEERNKAEAEAERRRQEEERKRLAAEEALKKQLAEEQRRGQEAQDREDQNVIGQHVSRIQAAITREFNLTGLQPGLSCVLHIRMIPGGEVVEARIVRSSGNSVFDSRAETAVKRASPLPVPDNPRIFGKMREIRITFAPQ